MTPRTKASRSGPVGREGTRGASIQRWGAVASFLLIGGLVVAPLIYLVGNLREPFGIGAYSIADFLYGPLFGASLITSIAALRERIGPGAERLTSTALITAGLSAGAMVLVACIRASNRQYHLIHTELHLENTSDVLVVWTTTVAGVTGAAWHFLGWTLLLLASAAWSTRRLPRLLAIAYAAGAVPSLFVYAMAELEGLAGALGLVWAIWQGIMLLRPQASRQATQPLSPASH